MLHVIGAVDKFPWDRAALWFESIRDKAPSASIHCVYYNLLPEVVVEYQRHGVLMHPGRRTASHVTTQRFEDIAVLAESLDGYTIATDVRDVVFQSDPEPELLWLLCDAEIVVQEEPQGFRDGHFWCEQNMRAAFPAVAGRMLDFPMVSAGMVAGEGKAVARLCASVYELCMTVPQADHPDQAALNVVLRLNGVPAKILPPDYPFCYHSALLMCHPKLHDRLNEHRPIIRDGYCYTHRSELYPVLHLGVIAGSLRDAVNARYRGAKYTPVQPADNYQKARYP